MIRAKSLHDALHAALGVDVTSALLVSTAGGLLAAAHESPENLRTKDHNLMVAVVVNLWGNYSHNNLTASSFMPGSSPDPENLEFVIAQFEGKRLCLVAVGRNAVLCLESNQRTEIGLLKLKAMSLVAFLEPQLKPVLALLDAGRTTSS